MIYLTTGQPGAGKTLYTLGLAKEMAEAQSRPVYYYNVAELSLSWIPFGDAVSEVKNGADQTMVVVDWSKIPDGSIIFIDEAWKVFPLRRQGSKVPEFVEFLATHRHHGLDIFLVTQDRGQLDTFVRKLVGRHYHVSRKFGFERVMVYQWEKVSDPTSKKDQEEALKTRWSYDRSRYGWYKSAEIHTAQRDFPKRVIVGVLAGAFAVGLLGWFAWHKVTGSTANAKAGAVQGSAVVTADAGTVAPALQAAGNPWAASNQAARVPGHAYTARVYDELFRRAADAPLPTGCMSVQFGNQVICKCSTDQGTDAGVSQADCAYIMTHGIYDLRKAVASAKAENIAHIRATESGPGSASAGMAASVSAGAGSGLPISKEGG